MHRSITQQHVYGCGVACVAYATRNTYQRCIKFLDIVAAKRRGFLCKDLVTALNKSGYPYTYKYLKPRLRRHIYREGVIVYIKRSKSYPSGHYLIRTLGVRRRPFLLSGCRWIRPDVHRLQMTSSRRGNIE